jgi:subtilisin family serine protease
VIRVLAALFLAGTLAGPAAAGTIVVGVEDGASEAALADSVEAATGGRVVDDLGPLDALVFAVPDDRAADALASLPGASYAEPVRAGQRRLFFVPNDPLYPAQWHLPAIHAFDHWAVRPPQPAIRVAVIDSGVDGAHPELAGRIEASRSFVGGSALVDGFGHGTIVAGEIAAAIGNGTGIAGAGIPVELLVAKVVGDAGTISILAESRAIRWAVDQGAQVINLSLGGRRDPTRPAVDTYSALEHDAVDYATRHGVVVVAAGGNCVALQCPERYASWPAALPHVIGVGALTQSITVPTFSNRDRRHIDVAAPGTDIVSLYPTPFVEPGCTTGYTNCPARSADGTSFASPLVASAAAVLLGERRMLALAKPHASQTTFVLERAAEDLGAPGRDTASGNGILDVDAALDALAGTLPPRDHFEPNDDAGHRAHRLTARTRSLRATLERWEDNRDVYRLPLRAGERLVAFVAGPAGSNVDLVLWRPGTETVGQRADRVAAANGPGRNARVVYRATRTGLYALELRLPAGRGGAYGLALARR